MTQRMAESTHLRILLLLLQLSRLRLDELPLMVTWQMLCFGDTNALRIIRKRNLRRRLTKTLVAASFSLGRLVVASASKRDDLDMHSECNQHTAEVISIL